MSGRVQGPARRNGRLASFVVALIFTLCTAAIIAGAVIALGGPVWTTVAVALVSALLVSVAVSR